MYWNEPWLGKGYNIANIMDGDIEMPPLLPQKEGICDEVHASDSTKPANSMLP